MRLAWGLGLLCLPLMGVSAQPPALSLDTQLARLAGPGWSARQLDLNLAVGEGGSLSLTVGRLDLETPAVSLTDLRLDCPDLEVVLPSRLACARAQLSLRDPRGQPLSGSGRFEYRLDSGALDVTLSELAWAGGQVDLQGGLDQGRWRLSLNARDLDAATLAALAGPLPVAGFTGRVDLKARLQAGAAPLQVSGRVQARELGFSSEDGLRAAEGLALHGEGRWTAEDGAVGGELHLTAGQLYWDPLLLEPPLDLSVEGIWRDGRLILDRTALFQDPVLTLSGRAELALGDAPVLEQARISLDRVRFPAVYERYLKPFLLGTPLDDLSTEGLVLGEIALDGRGTRALDLRLAALGVEDGRGRYGVQGLSGRLVWQRQGGGGSQLAWRSGHFYRMPVGAAGLEFQAGGGSVTLSQVARVPVLDGALVVEHLSGRGLDGEDAEWRFEGLMEPVSLGAFSAALDWPPLKGRLSGMVPQVRYADQTLTVGGALLARVFSGDITVTGLRLSRPLGLTPRLSAQVDLRGLDLAELTAVFDFGHITGTLEGQVAGLELENWHPVAFDARLRTPPDDPRPHRISQQAVQNLSSLGGAGAALSRGFLRVFDEFNYKDLGIRCRLENGICHMAGVAPAEQGYYLVVGQGLPRIDVIAYTRQVDWNELLARLAAAASSQGAVVR